MNLTCSYYIDLDKKIKECKKCHKILPFSEFVKNSNNRYGMWLWCKKCQKKQRIIWERENIKNNPWYNSYNNAKQRCENPNNPNYPWWGAKGIKFLLTREECKKLWIRDSADKLKFPTIDRVDNDGNYTYENCQFIENVENSMKDATGHIFRGKFIKYCKIGQYTLDNKLIKIWNSQGEISRSLHIEQSDISRVVNGIHKTCHGFIFKKIEE